MQSLRISEHLEQWRSAGVQLRAENGNIVVAAKKGALTADIASAIKLKKVELLAFLTAASDVISSDEIVPLPRSETLPLSSAQQRLWYIDLMAPGSSAFNIPFVVELADEVNVPALYRAVEAVIARHEALRTTFTVGSDGEPRQVIAPPVRVPFPTVDLSDLSDEDRPAQCDRWLTSWARQPFDLASGPLVRLGLLSLSPIEHVLSVTVHHIIYDGLSHEIFVRDLLMYYRREHTGGGPVPAPLLVQYADYAAWQRKSYTDIHLSFWKDYLHGPLPALDLPTVGPRPTVQTTRGAVFDFVVADAVVQGLTAQARKQGATLFMIVLAAWKAVLARFTAQDDIIVGTPIANRPKRETESMIGFFANTLAVRTSLAGDPLFLDVLDRVRKACLAAFSHQETPFDSVVKAVNPVRDTSRTAVYQTMFAMDESVLVNPARQPGDLAIKGQRIGNTGSAQTDISLSSRRVPEGLRFAIDYNIDLFERPFIEQLGAAFVLVLEHVAAGNNVALSALPLLSGQTSLDLLEKFCPPPSSYPEHKALHQWFEEVADKSPSKVALRCGEESITYAALEERANQLAHQLRAMGVQSESRVGVALTRSIELIVALLGVLKAQGAYVPLDPNYPHDRLAYMLDDSGATVLLIGADTAELLPDSKVARLSLEHEAAAIAERPKDRPQVTFTPSQLAYVIYTSGSTGQPKGVMIEHHNTANLFTALADQLSGGGVWFADTSVSFDISVLEIFGGLGHGFEVILRKDKLGEDLGSLFERFGVTHFQCTPSQLSILLADNAGCVAVSRLHQLIVGGEALPPALLRSLRQHLTGRLFNDYGPTETTVWSTTLELTDVVDPVPIGRPLANTRAYVLDGRRGLAPAGVIGGLWLGGAGVGRGYHNRPELHAERFVPDVFANDGSRMYDTGDKVRWRADGNLEYRGRSDAQVKIRGHRIELGEIENALRACAGVEEAAVVVVQDTAGMARIVAFFTPVDETKPPTPVELRAALKTRLPDVMLPEALNQIERMPLTPSGKADRHALLAMNIETVHVAAPLARPRNSVEAALATAFATVLRLAEVGIEQNFFELGGHSLLVVNLVRLLRDQHGIDLSIGTLFSAPTVAELAAHLLTGNLNALDGSVVSLRKTGNNLPLFCICGIQLYQPLVNALGEGQPVFGVFVPAEVRVLTGENPSKTLNVVKLATDYIKAMRKQQPRGPYCLAGISFGGVLAFEMAHQLAAAGEEIGVLALLDTVLPRGLSFDAASWVTGHLKRLTKENAWQALGKRLRRNDDSPSVGQQAFPGTVEDLVDLRDRLYAQAMKDYDLTIRPLSGKGLLFRAIDQSSFLGYEIDRSCGWAGLFKGGLDIHNVPGDHIGIISEKYVGGLASTLRRCLDRASELSK